MPTEQNNNNKSSLELSFEFFPPKNPRMERNLWRNVGQLEMLDPSFFSVTYGALGSEQDKSINTLTSMVNDCHVPIAAHLTAAGHSRESLQATAQQFHDLGIQRIVALRGDAEQVADGARDVPEMIEVLQSVADFDISVAAYPEVHPKAASLQADLLELKRKLDAGSNRALTQYFFNVDTFLKFRDEAAKIGIHQPIVPGILPINNFASAVGFSKRCGAIIPQYVHERFEGTTTGSDEQKEIGIDLAVEISDALIAEGVTQLHYYTLNVPSLTFDVVNRLGQREHLAVAA